MKLPILGWPLQSTKTLLLGLFLGTFLWHSWYSLHHFNFQQDLARDIMITEQLKASGTVLVGYGPKASVGNFYLPPLYYQVYLILAYLFPGAPFAMQWLIILVESASPVLLFLILRKLFNTKIAILLASCYAIFLIPMIFASFAWNPNMIPFFSLLSLYSFLRYLQEKKGWQIILGTLGITVAFSLHYQAVILLPFAATIFAFTVYQDRKNTVYWVYGGLLFIASILGYLLAEYQNHFTNTQHIIAYFTQEHAVIYERVSKPAFIHSFLPNFVERVMTGSVRYWGWFSIGRFLFLAGMLVMTWQAWSHRKKQPLHLYILLYFVLIFGMLRVYKGDKLDYYMSPLYILPTFLLAYLIKLHKAFAALLVLTLFFTFQFISRVEKIDQYADLQYTSRGLQQLVGDGDTRLYLYNFDDVNTFAFALEHFADIRINQVDTDMLEICSVSKICKYDGHPQCAHSREYTLLALLKEDGGYVLEGSFSTKQYQVVKGRLTTSVSPIQPFYQANLSVGTDKLLPQLYQ